MQIMESVNSFFKCLIVRKKGVYTLTAKLGSA